MNRFFGIIGIFVILGLAYLMSNNKKAINWRTIFSGLFLQLLVALFILKTSFGKFLFHEIGLLINKVLDFSTQGAMFVFGPLAKRELLSTTLGSENAFIFAVSITATIIFVMVLVNIAYYFGIMQKIVSIVAKIVYKIMNVSGSEAISNVASAFVGQVEAQLMVKPYVHGMTMSELLASMTGSMACIAGGVMAIYISMGVPAEYLLTASVMAMPGALVISKLVWPETAESQTRNEIKLEVRKNHVNLIDAISHGCSDGMKVSISVIAMLIGFLALIAMVDAILGKIGVGIAHFGLSSVLGIDMNHLSLKSILGIVFSGFAYVMGVPFSEASKVGALMGTKLVANEFFAYADLTAMMKAHLLSAKSIVIASFALCGFANLGSIGIQIGGIGEIAPERKKDLAMLGIKALICGTLASYLSATIAGILL